MTIENRKCLSTGKEVLGAPDENRSAPTDHLARLDEVVDLDSVGNHPHRIQRTWGVEAEGWTSLRTSWVGAILYRGAGRDAPAPRSGRPRSPPMA